MGRKAVQEIRNSGGFFCGWFLESVIDTAEINGYFAIVSASERGGSAVCSWETGEDCGGENIAKTDEEGDRDLTLCAHAWYWSHEEILSHRTFRTRLLASVSRCHRCGHQGWSSCSSFTVSFCTFLPVSLKRQKFSSLPHRTHLVWNMHRSVHTGLEGVFKVLSLAWV